MSEETPTIDTELARRIQSIGNEAIDERGQDPMTAIEALMLGTLSVARGYMPPEELAEYLRMVADYVERSEGLPDDEAPDGPDAGDAGPEPQ